ARRVGLGGDVRDLLQLQRAFEGDGQADVAAQVQEERFVAEAVGDLLDLVVALEEGGHLRRQRIKLVEDQLDLLGRQRLANLRELERDQREQGDLRGEGLRGCDADLEAAARIERGVD